MIASRKRTHQSEMNFLLRLQAIRERMNVFTHESFSSLDRSFGLDRTSLPQAEGIRYKPVNHVTLLGPNFPRDRGLAIA